MILDVDYLISFFEKHTTHKSKNEIGEQDAQTADTGTAAANAGAGTASVPKWEELYAQKRGKANPLMKSDQKWQTGMNRGVANQIW